MGKVPISEQMEITEQEKAEKALKESEARYRSLFENSIEGIGLSKDGRVISANRALLDVFGYDDLDEFLKVSIRDHVAPESRKMIEERIDQRKRGETIPTRYEYSIIRKDGEIRELEASSTVITIEGEKYSLNTVRDVTERENALKALKESEERNRIIFENAMDGILLADVAKKKFLTGNKRICDMLGYALDEIEDLGVTDIHPDSALPQVIEVFENQVRGKVQVGENLPVKRKDGSIFYADISSSIAKLDGEEYLIGIFRDVTERKEAEEALKDSEMNLRNIMDSIHAGIMVIDEETHNIIDANTHALEEIGAREADVIGKICHKFVCPADLGKCPISDLNETVDNSERVLVKFDGSKVPILKSVVPITFKGRRRLIESFIDISQLKNLEKENLESKDKIIAEMKKHEEYVFEVADRLRNPLQVIMGAVEILEDTTISADEKRAAIENLKDSSKLLERGIKDLT